jgi:hypothetical protein
MFLNRFDSAMPYQKWQPFPDHAIVQIKNTVGDSRIDLSKNLWWGWEKSNPEGVIVKARRLDRPREVGTRHGQ